MLRLAASEPAWLELFAATEGAPAVRIRVAPIGIRAVREARAAIRDAVVAAPGDVWAASDAMSVALLRAGLLDWEGVGDADGAPLPFTPEARELFLADPSAFEAADRAYVLPWSRREAEKNVSSGSPTGTSGAATPEHDTATSPAAGRSTAAAPRARVAKAARTTPTPSRAKPAKASGRSSPRSAGRSAPS